VQRLCAGALRGVRGDGSPEHVCERVHSEFQHVWNSRLHTCGRFGRPRSNNAKKHVCVVGHEDRPKSPALAHLSVPSCSIDKVDHAQLKIVYRDHCLAHVCKDELCKQLNIS
jgi:hypothetical protein